MAALAVAVPGGAAFVLMERRSSAPALTAVSEAFLDGMHLCLNVSGTLLVAAALAAAAVLLRRTGERVPTG
ncbi:hypothetical protein AB0K18_06600 [Nonomuraea sp. NPDC049421]|uniref:hypothetical protein n=1 Tax=Nonomuraea sp. NPDC049421 TaxID=3155275 RepID=UPI00341A3291